MDIRKLVREAVRRVIAEATCPMCGAAGAYVGMNDVECQNPACSKYVGAGEVAADSDSISICVSCNSESVAEQYADAFEQAGFDAERHDDINGFDAWATVPVGSDREAAKKAVQDVIRRVKGDDTESQGISDFFDSGEEESTFSFYDLRELHCPQCGTEGTDEPTECQTCLAGEPCPNCGQFNPSGSTDDCEHCHGMDDEEEEEEEDGFDDEEDRP